MSVAKKQVHLNLFIYGCGHHNAAWRTPDSAVERLGDIEYYEELARLAEKGTLDAVFFADGQSLRADSAERTPSWFLEPLTTLTALARATSNIGLVSTVSSSFYEPFHAARLLASLDHISSGRVGWNVVTSMFDAEARNHGKERLPEHAERYARAEEFIDAVQALWDSWPHTSIRADRNGKYLDSEAIHSIDHRGEYFTVAGPLNVPQPPQERPVLFQAGSSDPGRNLAARRAEGIYAVAYDLEQGKAYRSDVRARAEAAGRNPDELVVMPGLVPYVGRTLDDAERTRDRLDALLPVEASLQQLGGFIHRDCSDWDLDEPVPELAPLEEFTGPQGRYATILRIIEVDQPTVRQLLGRLAAGGGHCTMIGTPETIADQIEQWLDEGAADGFNLMPPQLPQSLDDFVELVIPELRRRGRFRDVYQASTLRGNLAG